MGRRRGREDGKEGCRGGGSGPEEEGEVLGWRGIKVVGGGWSRGRRGRSRGKGVKRKCVRLWTLNLKLNK